MARFDWTTRQDLPLAERYAELVGEEGEPARGLAAWLALVEWLLARVRDLPDDEHRRDAWLWGRFDEFIREADDAAAAPPAWRRCCVFVSHRSSDVDLAKRVAWLVSRAGFEYWLDVHDPVLAKLNAAPRPSPMQEMLVAAAVELALLNCTHVIALHTDQSHLSKWIPYEMGRAKSRRIFSTQMASWFHPAVKPAPQAGEYTWLGVRTHDERDISDWLAREAARARLGCRPGGPAAWPAGDPEPDALPRTPPPTLSSARLWAIRRLQLLGSPRRRGRRPPPARP